jgi:hypothetical protein
MTVSKSFFFFSFPPFFIILLYYYYIIIILYYILYKKEVKEKRKILYNELNLPYLAKREKFPSDFKEFAGLFSVHTSCLYYLKYIACLSGFKFGYFENLLRLRHSSS